MVDAIGSGSITSYAVFRTRAGIGQSSTVTPVFGLVAYFGSWYYANGFGSTAIGGTVTENTKYTAAVMLDNGVNLQVILNGASIYNAAGGAGASEYRLTFGDTGPYGAAVDVGALHFYAGVHDAAARGRVLAGLATRWGA
jgi:hypothetical protein